MYKGFHSEDEYLDARQEAREEAYHDHLDAVGVVCAACGTVYDPRVVRASRTDPSYEAQSECHSCGEDRRVGDVVDDVLIEFPHSEQVPHDHV